MRGRLSGLLLLVFWGCAGTQAPERDSQPAEEQGIVDYRDRLEAVGIGAPNPILPSETQRKATAREAAMVKARYELNATARALVLQSGITLGAAVEVDPALEDLIKQQIAGAETTTEFTSDDGCVVRLRLSKRRLAQALGVRFK